MVPIKLTISQELVKSTGQTGSVIKNLLDLQFSEKKGLKLSEMLP